MYMFYAVFAIHISKTDQGSRHPIIVVTDTGLLEYMDKKYPEMKR